EDHRPVLVSLDEDAALVVGGEVHRAEHPPAAPLAQPFRGGPEQRPGGGKGVLALEEPEHPVVAALELVPPLVDLSTYPPHRAPLALAQEALRLGVLEERVALAVEEAAARVEQRRTPP